MYAPQTIPAPVALVTGGSQGIGAASVARFLAAGWRVATLALPGENVHRWRARGVLTLEGDLTCEPIRELAVTAALNRFGRIDALVNNAGVGLYGSPSDVAPPLLQRLFEVNVLAPFELTQRVLPVMRRQQHGTVINLGSVAGHVSLPWAFGYCASKFWLHAFNDSLRRELRDSGIRVIKVCPGIVATRFRDNVLGGSVPAGVERLRLVVKPERIAEAILAAAEQRCPDTVYVPRIGRLFSAIDAVCPPLMDWYLARVASKGPRDPVSSPELSLAPAQSPGAEP